jgi:hypothetical protein
MVSTQELNLCGAIITNGLSFSGHKAECFKTEPQVSKIYSNKYCTENYGKNLMLRMMKVGEIIMGNKCVNV